MDAGDAARNGQGIIVMQQSKATAVGRVGQHKRNLMIEVELIEIHYGAPLRKRERVGLSAASAYIVICAR